MDVELGLSIGSVLGRIGDGVLEECGKLSRDQLNRRVDLAEANTAYQLATHIAGSTDLGALLPPRLELGQFPTPLHEASRLRAAFGGSRHAPRILIKRDDMTGFGLGGNKVRKLEFVLAEAVRSGATTVVGSGGRQSNLTRELAAAAAWLGLGCFLAL